MGAIGFIFITLCHNVSLIGKIWCVGMLLLRLLVVLFAGSTLFWDEQDKFICNTLHPGCSNVCFDTFTPVSVLRLWLLQILLLFLAHLMFATHVMHKVLPLFSSALEISAVATESTSREESLLRDWDVPPFYNSYLLVVTLRILLEVIFSTGQLYLVGPTVPKSFSCHETPCSSGVECFVSRPTEKTFMLNFMLFTAFLSILLSLADFVSSVKLLVKLRRKNKMLVEELSKGEQGSTFTTTTVTEDSVIPLMKRSESVKRSGVGDETNLDSSKDEKLDGSGFFTAGRNPVSGFLKPPVSPRMTTSFKGKKSGQETSFSFYLNSKQPFDQNVFQDRRAWV